MPPGTRRSGLPSYSRRFVHLAALWGYGVSQPILSMLKGNPEFLVINGASRNEAVACAIALAFLPPLVAVAVQFAVGLVSAKVASVLHVLCVWLFGFPAAMQLIALFEPKSRVAIAVALVMAYAGAIAYTRWQPLRLFLSYSLALPVLALVSFAMTAPLAQANTATRSVDVRSQTPVVLVVFDEFPVSSLMTSAGTIDERRYPGFGRLVREGTWYARAATVHGSTTHALPAILTGNLPRRGALPTLADHPRNLFTLLGGTYAFHVREPITRLCPARFCPEQRRGEHLASKIKGLVHDVGINYLHSSLPADLRGNISPLREAWGELVESRGLGGLDFVQSITRSDPTRTLHFLHVLQPHVPWATLPSGRHYGNSSVISGLAEDWAPGEYERWRGDKPWLVAQGLQRHLLQVGHVDRFLADLLHRLDQAGVYDRALIVVTADHGASFRSGGWRRYPTARNVADIAAVPLFVKYPRQRRGAIDRRDSDVVDILPTIVDQLGIRVAWHFDGRSLLAPPVVRDVRVGRRGAASVVASRDTVTARVLAAVRRKVTLLGEGSSSLYRFGPRRALIGRPVAQLDRMAAADSDVALVREAELASVDKTTGYVPVHVLGRVRWPALRPNETLAIAVNGSIAAMTTPFHSRGQVWFSTMVDENVLRQGGNQVQVFAVRGAGMETRLMVLG